MAPPTDLPGNALPASGPQLKPAIGIALAELKAWAEEEGQSLEKLSKPAAKLWREILEQSGARATNNCAPNLRRSDIAIPAAYDLSGRGWGKFMLWFHKQMRSPLTKACAKKGLPSLVPVRLSDPKGGNAEYSQALYYLAFEPQGEEQPTKTKTQRPKKAPPESAAQTALLSDLNSAPSPQLLPARPVIAGFDPIGSRQRSSTIPRELLRRLDSVDWLLVGTVALGIVGSISLSIIAVGLGQGSMAEADGTASSLVSLIEMIRDLTAPSPFAEDL